MTSKVESVEVAFKEIINETREAEQLANSISSGPPVEADDAQLDPETTNAQLVADHFVRQQQSKRSINGFECEKARC